MMTWRILAVWVALTCASYGVEESHEHEGEDHKGHTHGHGEPLFQSETPVAVGLTAGGTILVALTMLAILWKPIDAAFRRSRFRSRWEQRSTRVGFAVGTLILSAVIVGGVTYLQMGHADHDHHDGEPAPARPVHGGVATNADGLAFEMVARRTGEIRLYLTPSQGQELTAYDVKGSVTIPSSAFHSSANVETNQVLPLKLTYDGSFFGAYALPFESKQVPVGVSLKIKEKNLQLEFNLPVED